MPLLEADRVIGRLMGREAKHLYAGTRGFAKVQAGMNDTGIVEEQQATRREKVW